EAIRRTRESWHDGLAARLGRYHDDPEATFGGWTGVWLSEAFADWNIESFLPAITCPVLAIQGDADQYGTLEQVHRIGRGVRRGLVREIPGSRHSPHLDAPDATLALVVDFLRAAVAPGPTDGAVAGAGAAPRNAIPPSACGRRKRGTRASTGASSSPRDPAGSTAGPYARAGGPPARATVCSFAMPRSASGRATAPACAVDPSS